MSNCQASSQGGLAALAAVRSSYCGRPCGANSKEQRRGTHWRLTSGRFWSEGWGDVGWLVVLGVVVFFVKSRNIPTSSKLDHWEVEKERSSRYIWLDPEECKVFQHQVNNQFQQVFIIRLYGYTGTASHGLGRLNTKNIWTFNRWKAQLCFVQHLGVWVPT